MKRFVLAIALLAGCHPGPAPEPPQPVATADAGGLCDAACANLRALHCPAGDPTSGGTSCETVCEHDAAQLSAQLTPRYLECLANMTDCSEKDCRR